LETVLEGVGMKLLWVSHHLPSVAQEGSEWLQGEYRGGAEMSDADYFAGAPDWVDVWRVHPEQLIGVDVREFDRVLITGTDYLTELQMQYLALFKPMVFVHHQQTRTNGRMVLLQQADPFVCHTPAHLAVEQQWCNLENTGLVLSALNVDDCWIDHKEPFALWAARNHPLKGKNQAALWAAEHDLPFLAVSDLARDEVLALMASASWFLHFPLAFESECRSVMEAVLSGCTVRTNENVGITSYEHWDDPQWLSDEIDSASEKFWGFVCR
jgi:hypothetical protein